MNDSFKASKHNVFTYATKYAQMHVFTKQYNIYIGSVPSLAFAVLTCLSCFIIASVFPASSFLFFFRAFAPRSPAFVGRLAFVTGGLLVIDWRS